MNVPQKNSRIARMLDAAKSELRTHPIASIGAIVAAVTGLVALMIMAKLQVPIVIMITSYTAFNVWLGFSTCRGIWRLTTRKAVVERILFGVLPGALVLLGTLGFVIALWQDIRIINLLPDSEAVADQLAQATLLARMITYGFILVILEWIAMVVTILVKARSMDRSTRSDSMRAER